MHISRKTPKQTILKLAKDCEQCGHCCKFNSGFLIEEDGELKEIAKFLKISEDELKKHYLEEGEHFHTKRLRPKTKKTDKPYGECVFLKENNCMIHNAKPLQCRIGNCNEHGEQLLSWFWVNYFVNPDDPQSIREYASYLEANPTIPGAELENIVQDKEQLKKILKFDIFK